MEGIDADNQRQIAGIFQTFAHRLFEPAVAVKHVAFPVDPAFVFEGIAVGVRQKMLGGHVGRREREPGIFRRIRIFPVRDLPFELRGLLIRGPATDGRKALGRALPFKGQQIIARPLEGGLVVATAAHGKAAFDVDIADQGMQGQHGKGGVDAGGAHHAAVHVHGRAFAVSCQTCRQILDAPHRHAAQAGIFFQVAAVRLFLEQLQCAGHFHLFTVQRQGAPVKQGRLLAGPGGQHAAVRAHDHGVVLVGSGKDASRRAKIGHPQQRPGPLAGKPHQMRGIGKSGLSRFARGRQGGMAQKGRIMAVVVEDMADHAQGQG